MTVLSRYLGFQVILIIQLVTCRLHAGLYSCYNSKFCEVQKSEKLTVVLTYLGMFQCSNDDKAYAKCYSGCIG